MNPRHFLIVPSLSVGLFYSGQFIVPFSVAMGQDLRYAQQNQGSYAGPKEEAAPERGACDRIPPRYPTHDELAPLVVGAAVSFLAGFRIAAWMSGRHLARMKGIWCK